jgi:hypothetical protein
MSRSQVEPKNLDVQALLREGDRSVWKMAEAGVAKDHLECFELVACR